MLRRVSEGVARRTRPFACGPGEWGRGGASASTPPHQHPPHQQPSTRALSTLSVLQQVDPLRPAPVVHAMECALAHCAAPSLLWAHPSATGFVLLVGFVRLQAELALLVRDHTAWMWFVDGALCCSSRTCGIASIAPLSCGFGCGPLSIQGDWEYRLTYTLPTLTTLPPPTSE